jgi:CPA1 family monovalent cation:H+ antiporter
MKCTSPGCAISTSTVAGASSPAIASKPRATATRTRSLAYQRFARELLGAERAALPRLRSEGRISDEVRRRVERDLDLEDARLEI